MMRHLCFIMIVFLCISVVKTEGNKKKSLPRRNRSNPSPHFQSTTHSSKSDCQLHHCTIIHIPGNLSLDRAAYNDAKAKFLGMGALILALKMMDKNGMGSPGGSGGPNNYEYLSSTTDIDTMVGSPRGPTTQDFTTITTPEPPVRRRFKKKKKQINRGKLQYHEEEENKNETLVPLGRLWQNEHERDERWLSFTGQRRKLINNFRTEIRQRNLRFVNRNRVGMRKQYIDKQRKKRKKRRRYLRLKKRKKG